MSADNGRRDEDATPIHDRLSVNEYNREHEEAAQRLQRLWRRNRSTLEAKHLSSQTRWAEALTDAGVKNAGEQAQQGNNSGKARWKRASAFLTRLHDPDSMLQGEGEHVPDALSKQMETQHWLELIDGKHRYGSNLKFYFRQWQKVDTRDNFFRWLDHGEGASLDLKECPRQQLEGERIYYLNNKQRLNYLVNIDNSGRLRWAKNDQLVDTSAGQWKDAGDGQGIVPAESPDEAHETHLDRSDLSTDLAGTAKHYLGPMGGKNKFTRSLRQNFTTKGLVNKMMRKTLRKNTWIYASDRNYNIFVGIKDPGTFQHSSFLGGGLVTSAGLITVKDGLIYTLSPLSGHYRTSIDHFHQFLDIMKRKGVDMSKVRVTKAELALWGIEHVAKGKKKGGALVKQAKISTSGLSSTVRPTSEEGHDPADWKHDILFGRKRSRERN